MVFSPAMFLPPLRLCLTVTQPTVARHVMGDLAAAARRAGHPVLFLDISAIAARSGWAVARAQIRAFAPDLLLGYGIEPLLPPWTGIASASDEDPWTLAGVLPADLPTAGIVCDGDVGLERPAILARLRAAHVHLFCWDRTVLAAARRAGVRASFLPMAVNADVFVPPALDAPREGIVFIGGPTPARIAALQRIAAANLPLEIYGYDGPTWRDAGLSACYGGPVNDRDRLCRIYQRAAVTVNLTRSHGPASLPMRIFEALASGCVVVTDLAEEADRVLGAGIVVEGGEDLVEAIRGILHAPAERAARSARGRSAILAGHTYGHRIAEILPALTDLAGRGAQRR